MKLTLLKFVNPTFVEAFNRLFNMPLPIKEAYWLGKTARVLESESREFQEARVKAVKRYGVEDGNANSIKSPKDMAKFQAEVEELLKREVELPMNFKVVLPPETKMTAVDMVLLEDFIEPPAADITAKAP